MKNITSLAVAIFITAITASIPISGNATAMQNIKMSVITQNLMISKKDIEKISLLKNTSNPGISITLSKPASTKLSKLTGASLQKQLQISIGDQIISEPIIQGKLGAQFVITTNTESIAQRIYDALKA